MNKVYVHLKEGSQAIETLSIINVEDIDLNIDADKEGHTIGVEILGKVQDVTIGGISLREVLDQRYCLKEATKGLLDTIEKKVPTGFEQVENIRFAKRVISRVEDSNEIEV